MDINIYIYIIVIILVCLLMEHGKCIQWPSFSHGSGVIFCETQNSHKLSLYPQKSPVAAALSFCHTIHTAEHHSKDGKHGMRGCSKASQGLCMQVDTGKNCHDSGTEMVTLLVLQISAKFTDALRLQILALHEHKFRFWLLWRNQHLEAGR